jgi:hypothetical protein
MTLAIAHLIQVVNSFAGDSNTTYNSQEWTMIHDRQYFSAQIGDLTNVRRLSGTFTVFLDNCNATMAQKTENVARANKSKKLPNPLGRSTLQSSCLQ